jgi:hypothetical protein
MKNETEMTQTATAPDYLELCAAVEHGLANFLGTDDDIDTDVIDLVANRIIEHWDCRGTYMFEQFVESTSTYVQADLSEDELETYVECIIDQIDIYEV